MALYVTRPRRDEVRIGRGLPSGPGPSFEETWISFTQSRSVSSLVDNGAVILEKYIFWSCQLFFSLSHYFDIKEVKDLLCLSWVFL